MKTNDILKQIGENIRKARKGKRLSQERLAEFSDMHPSHISDIENGKVNASIIAYCQISQALNVPLFELVKYSENKDERKLEVDLTELHALIYSLDKRKKVMFITAARGLLDGLTKEL